MKKLFTISCIMIALSFLSTNVYAGGGADANVGGNNGGNADALIGGANEAKRVSPTHIIAVHD